MVNVLYDSALMVAEEVPGVGDTVMVKLRFVEEVPKYTPVIFALLVPVFLMTTLIVLLVGHDTFSSTNNTPACCVWVPVNVMTQAYVTMTAATAMTINRSVARIGEIPFLDVNIFLKTNSPLRLKPSSHDDI